MNRFDDAGRLDRRVEVLKFDSASRNALNEPEPRWTSAGTFSARQLTQRATEAWQAGQSAGHVECLFRFRPGAVTRAIAPRDRLSEGAHLFEVVGPPTEPVRGQWIDVACISVPV